MLNKQISTLSLEFFVRLLLYNNDDIASFLTRELVCFAMELVLAIVRSAFVDHSLEDFLLLGDLLALANLALVGFVNDFTFATAVITWALRLRVHTGSKLRHAGDHTTATASRALLDSAFFATEAGASCADAVS